MNIWMKRIYDNRKFIFYIVLIGIVLLPKAYTIFYSIPLNDDFSMANGCSKQTFLLDSVKRANEYYMNWSGLWFYMFIETLINPILLFPLESWWRGVEMLFLFMAFIMSFIASINIAMKRILEIQDKDRRYFFS